ncbi:MAG: hypothetical protein CV088_13270 [Nitrospira sp. LK70]|nr:hypothetical protein [Nitrospira sp. LK70]
MFRFRVLIVAMALGVLSAAASGPMVQAATLSEGATVSGGVGSPPADCTAARQGDSHCVPRGLRRSSRPVEPAQPLVTPPTTPPVIPPGTLPPGIPSATRPEDPELPLYIYGAASATLHIHDDDHDIVHTSDEVLLTFTRRVDRNMPGNPQYILTPNRFNIPPGHQEELLGKTQVIWMAEGGEFECTVKGKVVVNMPAMPGGTMYLDPTDTRQPFRHNITQPAYGYLNVVGPDRGDFHSVIIKAFDPDARLIKTCPGNPLAMETNSQAGFLLHILMEPNTREDGRVIFQGHQEVDFGDPLGFLNLLPPGAAIPDDARRALQSSGTGTSLRYTWTRKLIPALPSAP